ncbi:hypothetical protein ACTJJ0_25555 [Chitinophaga sp. 22321]|uniref:Uncharacterized protein n=1 Tax=Chitinophaga hostae TaxID=2831022 RepID=A0ABS5J5G1_9BACT|nr:hypothetical protein [Chitinophaga hostae]MBS0030446.1 hypothetical protein [Chitinophaga hostae]
MEWLLYFSTREEVGTDNPEKNILLMTKVNKIPGADLPAGLAQPAIVPEKAGPNGRWVEDVSLRFH